MLTITDEQFVLSVLEKRDARSHIGSNMLYQTQLADRCQMQDLSAPQPAYDLKPLRKTVEKHLTSVNGCIAIDVLGHPTMGICYCTRR